MSDFASFHLEQLLSDLNARVNSLLNCCKGRSFRS
jgi:hypothetical protein